MRVGKNAGEREPRTENGVRRASRHRRPGRDGARVADVLGRGAREGAGDGLHFVRVREVERARAGERERGEDSRGELGGIYSAGVSFRVAAWTFARGVRTAGRTRLALDKASPNPRRVIS